MQIPYTDDHVPGRWSPCLLHPQAQMSSMVHLVGPTLLPGAIASIAKFDVAKVLQIMHEHYTIVHDNI